MGRIIFATGCWQVIQAAAALSSDETACKEASLVLFSPGGCDDGDEYIEAIAKKVFPWKHVCWAGDRVIPPLPSRDAIAYSVRKLREFAETINVVPDEVWLTGIHRQCEKAIICAYPRAAICLFEDGLASYYNHEYTCGPTRLLQGNTSVLSWLKRELTHRGNTECKNLLGICSRDMKRLRCVFLSLCSVLDIPACWSRTKVVKMTSNLVAIIRKCQGIGNNFTAEFADNSVLCLGGRLHDVSTITFDDVCSLYCDVIRSVVDKGYNVLWKDHPKTSVPFYEELVVRSGVDIQRLPANQIPEVCLYDRSVAGVIGEVTTSLFNLNVLYGMPSYTCLPQGWINKLDPFDAWVAELILRNVERYERLVRRDG